VNALDVFYLAVAAASSPWWARKSRSGWSRRLARDIEPIDPPGDTPRILLHAVSVGEVNALRQLVPILVRSADVIVSASTDTGLARARSLYDGICHVRRYPLDSSGAVRRFLDAIRPDAVGLVELELWPNFISACRRRGIPVCVINGRLSERSFRGYRRFARIVAPLFRSLALAAVQDEVYARRFEALGVPPDRVQITGSMKWDAARIQDEVPGASDLACRMRIDMDRPLIVAGSTGPGEEALLHEACPRGVQLLCAPRRPERFDQAARDLPDCIRCSAHGSSRPGGAASGRFLLDTIGDLPKAYSLATTVVVGRSFGKLYGSDPIEPIALGGPTVIGPAVRDFQTIVSALESAGGLVRADRESLAGVLDGLIRDASRRCRMVRAGRQCIREHQGASDRHCRLLVDLARRTQRPRDSVASAR